MTTMPAVLAWIALALRLAHWLGLALVAASALLWLRQGATRPCRLTRRLGLGGLFLAAASAALWPLAYALSLFAPPSHWEILASLAAHSAPAWLPSWSDLITLEPLWPLAWRADPELPASHHALAQARQAWLVFALCLGAAALAWLRRHTQMALALTVAALLGAVLLQPRPELLWVAATPASFRQPDHPLHVDRMPVGERLYAQACLQCHGARGQDARLQPDGRWPTILGPSLFGSRNAGDLFWSVRHGGGTSGRSAFHASGSTLSDQDIWHILDYLRLGAAGAEAAQETGWRQALQAPDLSLRCTHTPARSLRDLRGRIVHLVPYDEQGPPLYPDPLLFTVALSRTPLSLASRPSGADCIAHSEAAWNAYALIAGRDVTQLAGTQFLIDRQGWLRSLAPPDASAGWSRPDSMCLPGQAPPVNSESTLQAVLQRIDTLAVDPPLYRPAAS